MDQAEFNQHMPHEFWREVVDRVAAEVPGTLLLAEAFWLMEGYFVRTLGMHRVYNSAFMNMMRDEENAKYRSVIKNTLEFDPDIMKRYVNFMSNPDERTAIDQFGKGDKCFGVAALMATLPGLPMFGHGQVEGFTEKYGMEYQRPRYDETPDHWLIERHEREIAPLLKRRWIFAESSNFLLYDLFGGSGSVDENVFAYSNRNGEARALVVYNNRYGEAHGTIDNSAAYADKATAQLRQRRLSEGLGLRGDSGAILAWRDSLTGLEYLRRANDLANQGLTLHLHAYQCHVFMDWHEKYASAEKPWDRLCDQLNGRGVPSLEDALVNMELQPAHQALRALLDQDIVRRLADLAEHPRGNGGAAADPKLIRKRTELLNLVWTRCEAFLLLAQPAYRSRTSLPIEVTTPGLLGPVFRERLADAMRIPVVETLFSEPWTAAARRVLPSPSPQLTATAMWGPIFAWCALETLAESIDAKKPEQVALDLFDRLRLREPLAESFNALGFEGEAGWRAAARIKILLVTEAGIGIPSPEHEKDKAEVESREGTKAPSAPKASMAKGKPEATEPASSAKELTAEKRAGFPAPLWSDPDVRWLTGAHESGGSTYFVREPYEELLWWLLMPSLLRTAGEAQPTKSVVEPMSRKVREALEAAAGANYRVDLLVGTDKQKRATPVVGLGAAESTPARDAAANKAADEAEGEPVTVNPEASVDANAARETPAKPRN
jgi:hypothetical protein